MKKTNLLWGFGVFALGFFFLTLIEPPPDKVTFQCDRSTGTCVVETTALFRSKAETIEIEAIDHARYLNFVNKYRGPDIVLTNGNAISIGIGSINPFTTKEQKHVEEINQFLKNAAIKHLSITHQRKVPTVILASILLLGAVSFLYKAMKPYVLRGYNSN